MHEHERGNGAPSGAGLGLVDAEEYIGDETDQDDGRDEPGQDGPRVRCTAGDGEPAQRGKADADDGEGEVGGGRDRIEVIGDPAAWATKAMTLVARAEPMLASPVARASKRAVGRACSMVAAVMVVS